MARGQMAAWREGAISSSLRHGKTTARKGRSSAVDRCDCAFFGLLARVRCTVVQGVDFVSSIHGTGVPCF
jgi:hypothetical protein